MVLFIGDLVSESGGADESQSSSEPEANTALWRAKHQRFVNVAAKSKQARKNWNALLHPSSVSLPVEISPAQGLRELMLAAAAAQPQQP